MTPFELRSLWLNLEGIESADSSEALGAPLAEMSTAVGFRFYAYFFRIQIDSELTVERSLSNAPFELVSALRQVHEPALALGRRSSTIDRAPYTWELPDTDPAVPACSGLAFSAQLVTPTVASLCLWSSAHEGNYDWTHLPEYGIAQMIAERITRVMEPIVVHEAIGVEKKLTSREAECLHWVSRGKSGWEIGAILGISENAVVFHIKNAMSKFGVQSRRHAVARAQLLGFIE